MVELGENVLLTRGAPHDAVIPPLTMPLCLHLNGDSHAVYRLFTKSKEQTERRDRSAAHSSPKVLCASDPYFHH